MVRLKASDRIRKSFRRHIFCERRHRKQKYGKQKHGKQERERGKRSDHLCDKESFVRQGYGRRQDDSYKDYAVDKN